MEKKYRPWSYESPIFLGKSRVDFIRKSQDIMLRLMQYLSENYASLEALLPHDPEVKTFLRELQDVPFQKGTFRTDFVVDERNEARLIEVTCRYPLNGYFRSVAANAMNQAWRSEKMRSLTDVAYVNPLLEKFLTWMGHSDRVVLIKGEDCRDNESTYLPEILSEAGIETQICSYQEWLINGENWVNNAAIIAELTFEEWLGMPIRLVRAMLKQPLLNDPRLVFIVHDKSFFGLVNFEEITNKLFTKEETVFIQNAFAETYFVHRNPEILESARQNPGDWVLKPRRLGRSVDIIAGSLSSTEKWHAALAQACDDGSMILQKWHLSKRVTGRIGETDYQDYFAGTLLYWGEEFFGPGLFRASCHPISNVKDNRMILSVVAPQAESKEYPDLQWI
jgi:hypothetical protein